MQPTSTSWPVPPAAPHVARFVRMIAALFAFVILLGLAACGGGGGGGNDAPADATPQTAGVEVQGSAKLPAGLAAAASQLQVITPVGRASVAADGRFKARVAPGSTTQIELVDAQGKLLMLGRADAQGAELSSRTTAEALLYFALGAFTLPAEQYERVLALIRERGELAALVAELDTAMAANPAVLTDGDAALTQAVKKAREAVLAAPGVAAAMVRVPANAEVAPPMAATTSREQAQATETNLVLIEPGAEVVQSGLQVLQNPGAGGGVVAQNSIRRWATLYAYQTGHMGADGQKEIYTTPKPVGTPVDVPETQQLNLFNAVGDVIAGTAPWSPVLSAPLALPKVADSRETYYDLVLVGPTMQALTTPALYLNPLYQSQVPLWKDKATELAWGSFFTDFVGPTVGFLMAGRVAKMRTDQARAFAASFRASASPLLAKRGFFLKGDSFSAQYLLELIALFGQGEVILGETQRWIFDHIVQENKDLVANFEQSSARLQRLARAAAVVAAVDAAMTALDIGAVIKDLKAANQAEQWTATVANSRVNLAPFEPKVSAASPGVMFTASVNGAPNGRFVYRWSTSGQRGKLFGVGIEGIRYDTTDKQAQYIVTTGAIADGVLDTVEVEVFDDDGSGTIKPGQVAVGKTSVSVVGQSGVTITPTAVELLEGRSQAFSASVPEGTPGPVTYVWTSTRVAGRVSGGTRFENTTGRVFYTADFSASGVDTVTVEAYSGPAGQRVLIGRATARIDVIRNCASRVPDGQLTGTFTFYGDPVGPSTVGASGSLNIYINDTRIFTGPVLGELYYCSGFRDFAAAPGDRLRIVVRPTAGANSYIQPIYLHRNALQLNGAPHWSALTVPLDPVGLRGPDCSGGACDPNQPFYDKTFIVP